MRHPRQDIHPTSHGTRLKVRKREEATTPACNPSLEIALLTNKIHHCARLKQADKMTRRLVTKRRSPSLHGTVVPCKLCNNATGPGPFAFMKKCHHGFHYQCLLNHFEVAVTAGKPATCPDCQGVSTRPGKVATVAQPPAFGGRNEYPVWEWLHYTYGEYRVWEWVHYKLQLARDREALALCYPPGGHRAAEDIGRRELYPLQALTNYFEMVNACWMCGHLIGNEYWVTLPACGHVSHTYCFVNHFHVRSTGLREAGQWPESYQCHLCEKQAATPVPSTIVPSDTDLTAKCSNHLREMRMEAAWFCARFRFLKEREALVHQPNAKRRGTSDSEDDPARPGARAVRPHLSE